VYCLVGLFVLSILTACSRESQWLSNGVDEVVYSDEIIIYTSGDYLLHRDVGQMASRATDPVRVEVLDSRVEMILTLLPPFPPDIDLSNEYVCQGDGFVDTHKNWCQENRPLDTLK